MAEISNTGLASHSAIGDLFSDGCCAAHIFIGRVCARSDETEFDLDGPVVLCGSLADLRGQMVEVRGEGAVDARLEGVEVNVDVLVVLGTSVSLIESHKRP